MQKTGLVRGSLTEREIYFSCNDGSVQVQQNQLALSSQAIWLFGMIIVSCLCFLMCAIERGGKRSQNTQTNQSNQLFHNFASPSFANVY
jgi:hypothetical protein